MNARIGLRDRFRTRLDAREAAKLPRFYFDWRTMRKLQGQTVTSRSWPDKRALRLIRKEGIENVWQRTTELPATHALGAAQGLPLFAQNPSTILTALKLPAGVEGDTLIKEILREEGISIAGGQLQLKGKIIRIAHMGFIGKADLDAGFAALEKRLARAGAR